MRFVRKYYAYSGSVQVHFALGNQHLTSGGI